MVENLEKDRSPQTSSFWVERCLGVSAEKQTLQEMQSEVVADEAIAQVSAIVRKTRDVPDGETPEGIAINSLLTHLLRQQREWTPKAHYALFQQAMGSHPDLAPFRKELLEAAQQRQHRYWRTQSIIGVAIAAVFFLLGLLF